MDAELLFKLLNMLVLPAWFLIIFFPSSVIARSAVFSHGYPIVLAVVYAVLIFWGMAENAGGEGGMQSLSGLRIAFENDKVLLGAWVHYLVFDMLVGIWIAGDALQKKLSKAVTGVCLIFTLMLGPVGFLMYKGYLRMANQNLNQA
jgi:hypothetical protein